MKCTIGKYVGRILAFSSNILTRGKEALVVWLIHFVGATFRCFWLAGTFLRIFTKLIFLTLIINSVENEIKVYNAYILYFIVLQKKKKKKSEREREI